MNVFIFMLGLLTVVVAVGMLSYQEGHYKGMTEFCFEYIIKDVEGYHCITEQELIDRMPKRVVPEYNFSGVQLE